MGWSTKTVLRNSAEYYGIDRNSEKWIWHPESAVITKTSLRLISWEHLTLARWKCLCKLRSEPGVVWGRGPTWLFPGWQVPLSLLCLKNLRRKLTTAPRRWARGEPGWVTWFIPHWQGWGPVTVPAVSCWLPAFAAGASHAELQNYPFLGIKGGVKTLAMSQHLLLLPVLAKEKVRCVFCCLFCSCGMESGQCN